MRAMLQCGCSGRGAFAFQSILRCVADVCCNRSFRLQSISKRSIAWSAGLLLVKRLIVLDPEDRRPVKEFSQLRKPVVLHPDRNLLEVLNIFQRGHCHLAIVTEQCAPRH